MDIIHNLTRNVFGYFYLIFRDAEIFFGVSIQLQFYGPKNC